MKVVFLYTELAEYFLNCCRELATRAEVHIFRYPVNKEAPFEFDFNGLTVYEKSKFSKEDLLGKVEQINPDVIVCSGWIDKDYNDVAKKFRNKVPVVAAFDTAWRGDVKQKLLKLLSPIYLHNKFSHAWVPGKQQYLYAQKLGFKSENILTGFYSCNTNYFNLVYSTSSEVKRREFPKKFLFVGRYYDFKGVNELWKAFAELQAESPNEWELWCAGTGDVKNFEHPKIKHLGFVQPNDMKEILFKTGVFILPSNFEPWGVVVHEHAAAGFPLLLSDKVGAAGQFLEEGKNGYLFQNSNIEAIKNAMKQIILLNSNDLWKMAEISHLKAQAITPVKWVEQLMNLKR